MAIQKIMKKSSVWWRHGKHGSQQTIEIMENKKSKMKPELDTLDLSKGDWSKRKG